MRIDSTQRTWAIAFAIIFAVSLIAYIVYSHNSIQGASGGSAIGLTFGALGFAFMLFAALLGARKRVPVWRLGRAQAWMRGHLWLGALSLPIILFHGGFHFGGTLTRVLMWLLIFTVFSGLFGAVLQHYIPRVMTADVPLETIYDEIGNVRNLLLEEADRAMEALCGAIGSSNTLREEIQRAGGFTAMRPMAAPTKGGAAVAPAAEILLLGEEESSPLRHFYFNEVRPFLERPAEHRLLVSDASRSPLGFSGLRTLLPARAHATVDDLEDLCEEARQLKKQQRLHRWLHLWLLVHIPISLALIVLGVVHAVMALKY
ncbi:MAG TPA: hypothetical protein VN037_15885 [Verrucomicrobiae bacterium]|jgi:hypothetical protein|nr:hypothetical protein [Verrucomicrobiae bacterium]